MADPEDERETDLLIDTICVGCDLPFPVNDLGLCDECFAKLERDLIRARDWDYSATAFMIARSIASGTREFKLRTGGKVKGELPGSRPVSK